MAQDKRPYTVTYHGGWESRIKNTDSLTPGTGARYLRCLIGEGKDLIACSWHRKEPAPETGYMVFSFPR